jgi:Transcriptional regulatory protein, C terminal
VDIRWKSLQNPYLIATNTLTVIPGHISGRSEDIAKIITGAQGAILLTGAPRIGKSLLIRYLQLPPGSKWSWRNELEPLREQLNLDRIHFVTVDLTPPDDIKNEDQLLRFFIKQCASALQPFKPSITQELSATPSGLYKLVRTICQDTSGAGMRDERYFLMFDTFERLEQPGVKLFERLDLSGESEAQTPQERGIALLNHCGAIHTLIDLMDEFSNFGVIFSLVALPRPKIGDQFSHVSADLARFTPITLQAFTWDDALKFLQQPPENFDNRWAQQFKNLGGTEIFSKEEQNWISQLAGTHPYLLQQCCFHTFDLKQEYAQLHDHWTALQASDEKALVELINERLSTFLTRLWKRLQEAISKCSPDTNNRFNEFIRSSVLKTAQDEISTGTWDSLGADLRYILQNEGLVRYDPFHPIHYPGTIVCQYLLQKLEESSQTPQRGFLLTINRAGSQREQVSLSELEYRLLKTLIQHPQRCPEEDLMKGAWGRIIEKPTFTQRMHQLRKKLRDRCEGTEIIENHYGGFYSLNHPEWFYLE